MSVPTGPTVTSDAAITGAVWTSGSENKVPTLRGHNTFYGNQTFNAGGIPIDGGAAAGTVGTVVPNLPTMFMNVDGYVGIGGAALRVGPNAPADGFRLYIKNGDVYNDEDIINKGKIGVGTATNTGLASYQFGVWGGNMYNDLIFINKGAVGIGPNASIATIGTNMLYINGDGECTGTFKLGNIGITNLVVPGYVGLGTATYSTAGTVGIYTPTTIHNTTFSIYNSTTPVSISNTTNTSASVLNDPQNTFRLVRYGTGAQSGPASVYFALSRWENQNWHSRTRLDIKLGHNFDAADADHTTPMTIFSDGRVNVNSSLNCGILNAYRQTGNESYVMMTGSGYGDDKNNISATFIGLGSEGTFFCKSAIGHIRQGGYDLGSIIMAFRTDQNYISPTRADTKFTFDYNGNLTVASTYFFPSGFLQDSLLSFVNGSYTTGYIRFGVGDWQTYEGGAIYMDATQWGTPRTWLTYRCTSLGSTGHRFIGTVAMGTTPNGDQLAINGNIGFVDGNNVLMNRGGSLRFRTTAYGMGGDHVRFDTNGSCYQANNSANWATSSDKRVKENIEVANYEMCNSNIENIDLYRFNYSQNYMIINDQKQLGFIADIIENFYPKSVSYRDYVMLDGSIIKDFKSIDISQINFTLYGAVKYLQSSIKNIKNDLNIINEKYLKTNICKNNNIYHENNIGYIVSYKDKKCYENLYSIELSSVINDKKIAGVISSINNNITINNNNITKIYVCDYNGKIEIGDYITTSPIKGIGMKQNDDILHNYTVAKIITNCDFNPKYIPMKEQLTSNYYINYTNCNLTSNILEPKLYKNFHTIDNVNIKSRYDMYCSNIDNYKCEYKEFFTSNIEYILVENSNINGLDIYTSNIYNSNILYYITNYSNIQCPNYNVIDANKEEKNIYCYKCEKHNVIKENIYYGTSNYISYSNILYNNKIIYSSNYMIEKTINIYDDNGYPIYKNKLDNNSNIIYDYEYDIKYIDINGNIKTYDDYISNNMSSNIYKMALLDCKIICS
jgi:hypothetical protein